MHNKKTAAVLMIFFLAFSLLSCSRRSPPAEAILIMPTPTLAAGFGAISGTLTLSAPAEGKTYHVYVFSQFDGFSSADGYATGTCGADTSVPFYVSVPPGAYYIAVYVDTDNSGAALPPNPGDLAGVYGATWPEWPIAANAIVSEGQVQDCSISMVTGTPNINGTISLFNEEPGKNLVVYMDLDAVPDNSNHAASSSIALNAGQLAINYSLLILVPETYYLYAGVDVDGTSGFLNTGDQLGYCGVCSCSPTTPPITANIYIIIQAINTLNFILGKIP